jgi:hypothetical protein
MVTHRSAAVALLSIVVLPFALLAACDKVPLLAPTGSVITLLPATTTVSLNSEVTITATVIENGTAPGGSGTGTTSTRSGGGTPVQNGTLVSFTTTIGRIEPSEARTHNGSVTVKLITTGASGTATITAFSGGASATRDLKIGTAAVKTVTVTTTPQALGASGGNVQVSAVVTDEGGNTLGGVPVIFATDKGSVNPSTATTDGSGVATATLNTTATAKITATAGTATSSATVSVNVRGLSGFTASPNATSAGVPVTFTVTPTTGANLSNVRVDFGDGSSTNLGAISAAATTPHPYSSSGTYTATATSFDSSGDSGFLTTQVTVGSLPITLSASPSTATVNAPVTFNVSGLGSALVDHYEWTFVDDPPGSSVPRTTTAPQTTVTFGSRGVKTIRVVVVGVGGGQLGTQEIKYDVQ